MGKGFKVLENFKVNPKRLTASGKGQYSPLDTGKTIDAKKKNEALKFLPKLNSELMKIAKTGIIKKQNASRNVSRITKKISAI